MKHDKLVELLSNFYVKPPMHESKAPQHKRKAPLLKTFWWRFWWEPWSHAAKRLLP